MSYWDDVRYSSVSMRITWLFFVIWRDYLQSTDGLFPFSEVEYCFDEGFICWSTNIPLYKILMNILKHLKQNYRQFLDTYKITGTTRAYVIGDI